MSAQDKLLGAVGAGIAAAGTFGSIGKKKTEEQKQAKSATTNPKNKQQSMEAQARKAAERSLVEKREVKRFVKEAVNIASKKIQKVQLQRKIAASQSADKMKRRIK